MTEIEGKVKVDLVKDEIENNWIFAAIDSKHCDFGGVLAEDIEMKMMENPLFGVLKKTMDKGDSVELGYAHYDSDGKLVELEYK